MEIPARLALSLLHLWKIVIKKVQFFYFFFYFTFLHNQKIVFWPAADKMQNPDEKTFFFHVVVSNLSPLDVSDSHPFPVRCFTLHLSESCKSQFLKCITSSSCSCLHLCSVIRNLRLRTCG